MIATLETLGDRLLAVVVRHPGRRPCDLCQ
jgi:hypothetical protein